jgi:hypothetical protein
MGCMAVKPRKVMMNNKQYLEFEDWQLLARFYGMTASEAGEPEFIRLETGSTVAEGFKANGIVLFRGVEISRATAYCLNDEERWATRACYKWMYVCRDGSHSEEDPGSDNITWEPNPNKPGKKRPKKERVQVGDERVPLFQLASMAQTRANAKALRNVLSGIVVLAGYGTTPAEEIIDMAEVIDAEVHPAAAAEPVIRRDREPGADDEPLPAQTAPKTEKEKPPLPPCPRCKDSRSVMVSKFPGNGAFYCKPCKVGFDTPEAR